MDRTYDPFSSPFCKREVELTSTFAPSEKCPCKIKSPYELRSIGTGGPTFEEPPYVDFGVGCISYSIIVWLTFVSVSNLHLHFHKLLCVSLMNHFDSPDVQDRVV